MKWYIAYNSYNKYGTFEKNSFIFEKDTDEQFLTVEDIKALTEKLSNQYQSPRGIVILNAFRIK